VNTTEKKAKLIVAAILAYTGRTDETGEVAEVLNKKAGRKSVILYLPLD
jgi:hypothetical protein